MVRILNPAQIAAVGGAAVVNVSTNPKPYSTHDPGCGVGRIELNCN